MLDLLVSLAAKSRLSPSGLSLLLVSEQSSKPASYTPNQTIGSLEGRVVHIVTKDVSSQKSVNRSSKKEKPFEVTQRFTVNLPTGQKTVLRVSPLTTVGDAVISACKEKGLELDLEKYVLQVPKKPGIPIDPRATIQGVQEVNLVSLENAERNYAMSMPDLSKMPPSANDPHSFAQLNGQPKKKRGFLSFLGRKDKQFKTEVRRSLVLKSTSTMDVNTPPAARATTLLASVSPEPDQNHHTSRPKSMFVSSDTLPLNDKPFEQHPQTVVAPPRKKRRAPEPPVLLNSHTPAQQESQSLKENVKINMDTKERFPTLQEQAESHGHEEILYTSALSQPVSCEEVIYDNNGHCHLNLNGHQSSESHDANLIQINTNINVNSSINTEDINEGSKANLTSKEAVLKDTLNESAELKIDNKISSPHGDSDTSSTHKKIKAPVPPSPVLTSSSHTMETSSPSLSSPSIEATASTDTLQTSAVEKDCVHLVQTHSDIPSIFSHQPEIESPTPGDQKEFSTSNISGKQEQLAGPEDQTDSSHISVANHLSFSGSKNEPAATMDFNDILDGVVFEEEPWSLELGPAKRAGVAEKDPMMMMETASVTSEDIDQIDGSTHASRPCAFIPPPPPSEPPPPEHHPVDFEPLTSLTTAPIFVDRGTGVSEDNASLATSSAKSSPGQASYGGLNEMALFIGQMNSITLENSVDQEGMLLDDSMNKAYASAPIVTSDSLSQSSHLQADSWHTSSEMDLLAIKENQKMNKMEAAHIIGLPEDIEIFNEEASIESEDFINNLPTLPPPPQFEDNVDILQEDESLTEGKEEEKVVKKEENKDEKVLVDKEYRLVGKEEVQVDKEDKEAGKEEEEKQDQTAEKEEQKEDKKPEKELHKVEKEDKKVEKELHNDEKEYKKEEKELHKVETEDKKAEKVDTNLEKEVHTVEKEDKTTGKEEETAEKENITEEDEEEYYTEITEELIIPLGPNGYDFAAARKKTEVELTSELSRDTLKSNRNETFRTESDAISNKPSIVSSFYQLISKQQQLTSPTKKEEFVLTTDDLSKVSFLPPKPKIEKSSMENHPSVKSPLYFKNRSTEENQTSAQTSSKFQIMPNLDYSTTRSATTSKYDYENIKPTFVQSDIISKSKTQPILVSTEKPTILPKPSYIASSVQTHSVPVSSDDESLYMNDPLLTKSRPHLLMNSHSNPLRRSAGDHTRGADYSRKDVYNQRSVQAGAGSDAVADSGEQTSSVTSGYNADTQDQQEVLQRQYLALKSQIQQWQDQLAWNQSVLASQAVGSDHQAEHLQQLSDQMTLQQEMAMQQLQSTLLALQQQQLQHMPASGQENGEPSAEFAARVHQPVAGAAEPTYVAVASPPAVLSAPQKQPSDLRSGTNTIKKRPKIERELGPREQLMIAIRTFSKRDLKSVPIEMTRWTPSALS
ncbi:hypothetical protein BsWGS_05084 [Bradybaena similaris]